MFRLFDVVAAAEDPIILVGRHGGTGVATLLDVLGEPVERYVQPIAPLVVVLLLFFFAILVVQMTVMASIFVIFLTVLLIWVVVARAVFVRPAGYEALYVTFFLIAPKKIFFN